MTQFNMVDPGQGPDIKRLLLAVVVSSAILMAYSYFFPQQNAPIAQSKPTPELKKEELRAEAKEVVNEAHAHFAGATSTTTPLVSKEFVVPQSENAFDARTSYKAQISSRGALLSEFVLTDFSQEKPLLSEQDNGSSWLRLTSRNNALSVDENSNYEIVSSDASSILFRFVSSEGLQIDRHYQFHPDGKISEIITWKNLSKVPLKSEFILSAVKDGEAQAEPGLMNPGVQAESLVVKLPKEHEKLSYKDLATQSQSFHNCSYVAFDDQFFISAFLLSENEKIEKVEARVKEINDIRREARFDIHLKPFILMNGEEKSFSYNMFMGPKQVSLLASVRPPLDENIDFGWFGILSRPMLWLLVQIFGFVHNYGIAIILITLIIKLLTYPLTAKSFSSQQSMKVLQPKLKELQGKFGHDRTLLGQKQMELYKQHGVNPVAGCLPMLIQLPIWFAFFQMLRSSVELLDQPFYWWIKDLTRPDQYFVLPVLMGLSMLIQQIFTPPPADQPQMKYVMWAMPIFLTFIMLKMPSGLSLYILTNNLLTILQQIIIKRQSIKVKV
ncbi:MAG: membrane protein insertase YidC [Myxococcales bacterium]|nr:membrane protein insertase YidC [Myxococcales bacterium]USN51786.1 MAG: membrane protein insertase YidC [Myxococcales bacterium]